MGGFFGVVSDGDCVSDLFYGTDYHSHLGTKRGGLAVKNEKGLKTFIHNIENTQFRTKFEDDIPKLMGNMGIGIISDYDDQPLIIGSHLGTYAIVTVGRVNNTEELIQRMFRKQAHFTEMSGGFINPTELVAALINEGSTFEEGIANAQAQIEGSCSMLLLTRDGIYAGRDKLGRTPVIIGEKDGARALTLETCALPNLDYERKMELGPGEIVRITQDGIEALQAPGDRMQICAFLWVYYGYPASSYEGINVEASRYRCGAALARKDDLTPDFAAGIPDSGTGHAIGYANEAGCPYQRPFVKYTPTWPRSFMPQTQAHRNLIAKMKLIPVKELVANKRALFCEDSIVRGTQLQDTVKRLFDAGAAEIHMRPACPPLIHGCKFLNFSRSRSEMELATRKVIHKLEGDACKDLDLYANPDSDKHLAMVETIRAELALTSLKFQRMQDMVEAIGLPKNKLCTYCWDACEGCD